MLIMKNLFLFLVISFLNFAPTIIAQTANDHVPPYDGTAYLGTNMGYFPGWTDEQLADVAMGDASRNIEGAGMETMRPALYDHFLEKWGYDVRVNAFQHYINLGMKDLVCFIGEPSEEHREKKVYCEGVEASKHFANIYEPIWDDGQNGTPVNDENYFALFVYKTVSKYGDFVKIWEIWNEPDLADRDFKGHSYAKPGTRGSWWDNNPNPCEYKMRAPVFHYVRTLRIAYEVIKKTDPDAFVAIGGIGYPSFLDAVLRNTDNPSNGEVEATNYPLKGGAYFDVMSYHAYPHIDGSLREWQNFPPSWKYERTSDNAIKGVFNQRDRFRNVLHKYGYEGKTYPKKHWIITEVNIPRKQVKDFIGSDDAQKNFLLKLAAESKKEGIKQLHLYNLAEGTKIHPTADDEFAFMGIYETLNDTPLYQHRKTTGGIAYQTAAILFKNSVYDTDASDRLPKQEGVRALAFRTDKNDLFYVLWAECTKDQSEIAEANYPIQKQWLKEGLEMHKWDFAIYKKSWPIDNKILKLSGTPIILKCP